MATHHQQSNCGGFPAKFCKVIVDSQADDLRIPQEFVRRHGQVLPNHVFLKVPTGKSWEVEVIKSDGEILLKKGWEKFQQQYSVKFGDFLVFEYDGDSKFNVFIFDMTCTQIEYPPSDDDDDDDDDDETGSESDNGVEFLEEISNSQKSKGKRPAVVRHQEENILRKKSKTDFLIEKSAHFPVRRTSRRVKLVGDHNENNNDEEDSFSGTSHILTKQLMLHDTHRLTLPKGFTKGTKIRAHRKIILKDVKGREWKVSVVGGTRGICAFGSGWNVFLKNNKVIIGSTMSFKFVSSSGLVIEARVVKAGKNRKELFNYVKNIGGRLQIVASDQARKRPAKVPINVESGKDDRPTKEREHSFRVGNTWKFSRKLKKNQAYKLDLPKEFAKESGIAMTREIWLKDGSGREWPVQVATDRKCRRYFFTIGWKDFLKANNVLEGNTVSFSFKSITSSKNVIEARVLRNGTKGILLFRS